jgi:hypothetical protein
MKKAKAVKMNAKQSRHVMDIEIPEGTGLARVIEKLNEKAIAGKQSVN